MNSLKAIKSTIYAAIAILAAVVLLSNSAYSQSETATMLGTIRDANSAVLQGANVNLKNNATGISSVTTTDANGDYQFVNIRVGTYQITVEANGFNKTVAQNIGLSVNARQRVDLTLQVATASETVTITGAAQLLESDSSDRGQVVQRQQIVALPLNGRSYANLALLSPGGTKRTALKSSTASLKSMEASAARYFIVFSSELWYSLVLRRHN